MRKIYFGLRSAEGDRLGHLVRGVQMLGSYGKEADVVRYSDVVNVDEPEQDRPSLHCVLECMSDATAEGLHGVCRETQWALGDQSLVLTVQVVQDGREQTQDSTPVFAALVDDRLPTGGTVFMPRYDFANICSWGQQIEGTDDGTIGEWPGRG